MDKVCHFEVPYADKDRAHEFYQKVFGWQIMEMPGMDYAFAITTPLGEDQRPTEVGGINGGFYQRGEEGSRTPVIVIEVESCEQRLKDAVAAGGTAVSDPHQIADMGIYAQVKDTEDNIIGLWQPLHG